MTSADPTPPPRRTPIACGLVVGLWLSGLGTTWAAAPVGRVAIFRDAIPVAGAGSSPERLAALLEPSGFATAFLDSSQLANAPELNRARFDVLVLPYGASFPVKAADNFRAFLRSGGKFLSTGGYAFDHLLERTTDGWRPYQSPTPPALESVAWFHDLPATELRGRGRLTFRGFLKADAVAGPGFAHFSVYQIATNGSLPTWRDLCQVRGTQDWREYRFDFEVHPDAASVSLRAGLYRCRGAAWFDDVQLTDAAGKVLLEAGFEQAPEADHRAPRTWWRSHAELCTWQSAVVHSGAHALGAKLDFALPHLERLNTRAGRPEDGLEVEPTQLGVFQADYRLRQARAATAAPRQSILPASLSLDGPLEGWAACGVVGWDAARWVPLVNTYDRYGRLRGAAGGMLRHFAGPWAGSSWAFFGVTNRDLFASGNTGMDDAFVRMVGALVTDTYFASLTTDQACYRQGESVTFRAPVFNGGREPHDVRVQLEIYAGEPGRRQSQPTAHDKRAPATPLPSPVARLSVPVQALPGQTNAVTGIWQPPRFTTGFYHVVARLEAGTNELDCLDGGFVVWDPKVIAGGPRLDYRGNYLRYGKRPLFLFGTDDWGYVFQTARETPLQWLQDMRLRRDLGVLIYENLQFGLPASPSQQATLLNKVDGLVQLAQQYNQVYFAGLLIGANAAASERELAAQRNYVREFAGRYATVPGLIHYLNGDYRCVIGEAVTPLWNQFLRDRYGSNEKLAQAWGRFPPSQPLGQIPAEDHRDWEQTWDDISAFDRNCFRAWLLRRWNSALIAGIRERDATHPTSGEFYQLPHGGVDLPAGIDGLDLANFGFFEQPGADLAKFPALCVYNDQRARGKSGGPGEYGVKTHPAWGDGRDYGYHTARTDAQALELFLAIPHYALGLGASRIHNWCWKDDAHRVFPWGMVYPCDGVPKDLGYAHRNVSFLFRHFAPVYEEPAVYVLTPDNHRLGGAKWQVTDGILTCIDLALANHVANLGTLNEHNAALPRAAKAIFYPLPFCPSDDAYARVLAWVRRGGVLYLSGDISFDELRRRSRPQRLEELCGVRFLAENYAPLAVNATNPAAAPIIRVQPQQATVRERAPDESPLLVEHRVGRGRVLFSTDPLELHSVGARRTHDLAVYRRVLELAGIAPLALEPENPRLHVMQVPLRDAGRVLIVFNGDTNQPTRSATLKHGSTPVGLTIARQRPALVWFNGSGAVRAVEVQGDCVVGAETILHDETQGIVLALDGQDVRHSEALLVMPQQAGRVNWRSTVRWREPVIETGEIRDGVWQIGETRTARRDATGMAVVVSPDQAFLWLLVGERTALPRWRRALERALNDPASLP